MRGAGTGASAGLAVPAVGSSKKSSPGQAQRLSDKPSAALLYLKAFIFKGQAQRFYI
jgi:hypothetical protein